MQPDALGISRAMAGHLLTISDNSREPTVEATLAVLSCLERTVIHPVTISATFGKIQFGAILEAL